MQTKTFPNFPVTTLCFGYLKQYQYKILKTVLNFFILICGYHFQNLYYLGLDKFKGKIIHSHDYKTLTGYEDKRVVIIGIGNSGGDAAVELSRVAKNVTSFKVPFVSVRYQPFLCLTFTCSFNLLEMYDSAGVFEHTPRVLGHQQGRRLRVSGGYGSVDAVHVLVDIA